MRIVFFGWLFLWDYVKIVDKAVGFTLNSIYILEATHMKKRWKFIGLLVSLLLEIFFCVSYLSLFLVKVGSPIADVIWLLGGIAGIAFGVINLIGCRKNVILIRVLSFTAIAVGIIQIPLWCLAIFISAM